MWTLAAKVLPGIGNLRKRERIEKSLFCFSGEQKRNAPRMGVLDALDGMKRCSGPHTPRNTFRDKRLRRLLGVKLSNRLPAG